MVQRVALVTGGGAGIGRACCLRLAQEGHAIGVMDINRQACDSVAAEITERGGKALALCTNITDRAAVMDAVAQLREAFGPVTIVVNNAGISEFYAFEDLTDEDWDRTMDINLKGTFIVTQSVLPDMKAAQWGRIVNISSSSAQTGAANLVHYAASKGGMVAMTRSLANELGPFGITVNNIPPGSVMNTVMSEANREKFNLKAETLERTIPVRRTGVPEDIANACAWLVQEESGYVTGQTIGVNGGRVVS